MEFYTKHLKDLLEKHNIQMYSTENERILLFVRDTIKSRMWKQFTAQGNTKYLEILPKILKKYNNINTDQ